MRFLFYFWSVAEIVDIYFVWFYELLETRGPVDFASGFFNIGGYVLVRGVQQHGQSCSSDSFSLQSKQLQPDYVSSYVLELCTFSTNVSVRAVRAWVNFLTPLGIGL